MSAPEETYRPPPLLRSVSEALKSLNSSASLDDVLWRIAHTGRLLLDAKYGAVAVLKPDGSVAEFIVDGLSEEQVEAIGDPPQGHGLLGAVIRLRKPIRIPDVSRDVRRHGFPPNHPIMTSFLGVPIQVGEEIVGNLYVTDKQQAPEFTPEDEWIAMLLAEHAAIAVRNARLTAAQETFISVAAHELRTPVAGALLAVETAIARIEESDADGEMRDLLLDVQHYVQALSAHAEELLDVSRLERGTLVLNRRMSDLRTICESACKWLAWSYGEHRIRRCMDAKPVRGNWDESRMERAALNVIENALRYSPRDTVVDVIVEAVGSRGRLVVSDRGPGIPEKELPRIWKPFNRGSAQRGDYRGAGIGLYVVREVVEAHGGSVLLDTEVGKGTTVSIELPLSGGPS